MSALLPDGFVQGRLPHGWRIAARIVYETGVIEITSPDTERFLLNVDVFNLGEYSSTHKPNVGVLGDACLEGKYTAGVLRYDTTEVPEFWLEVHVKDIMDKAAPHHYGRLIHLMRTCRKMEEAFRHGAFWDCARVLNAVLGRVDVDILQLLFDQVAPRSP